MSAQLYIRNAQFASKTKQLKPSSLLFANQLKLHKNKWKAFNALFVSWMDDGAPDQINDLIKSKLFCSFLLRSSVHLSQPIWNHMYFIYIMHVCVTVQFSDYIKCWICRHFLYYFMNLFDVNSYAFISLPFILHLLHACRTHTTIFTHENLYNKMFSIHLYYTH